MRYFEETSIPVSDGSQVCGHWVEVEKYENVLVATSFQSRYSDVPTARRMYTYGNRLCRLIVNIGIDNRKDIRAFCDWWADHGANCQRTFLTIRELNGVKPTFYEWALHRFLDWLEPMSEDDIQAQEEYNDNYQQEWLVMGEERSAKVELNFASPTMDGKDGEPHKFIYTAGDYPTFKRFCYLGWANQEVIKWTGH